MRFHYFQSQVMYIVLEQQNERKLELLISNNELILYTETISSDKNNHNSIKYFKISKPHLRLFLTCLSSIPPFGGAALSTL